jgi:hypothetical protein
MDKTKGFLASLLALTAGLARYAHPIHTYKMQNITIVPSIRNPKDPIKRATIERRRKATKLSKLSKSKRRTVYYYNLRHPVKMYA